MRRALSIAIAVAVLVAALLGMRACGAALPPEEDRGAAALAAAGTLPRVGKVIVDWHRGREPRERIAIGRGGVAAGPVSGPLAFRVFATPERAADLQLFVRTYRPFRARIIMSGELVFRGEGRARPSPAEMRMIVEWSRRVAAEATVGRSAEYGLALSWHRGEPVGACDQLAVALTGEVLAGTCFGESDMRGRLQPQALARLYGWFDAIAPFQTGRQGQEGGDSSRLVFAGRGPLPVSPRERAEMEGFAAALFQQLAARHRPAPPPPPPAVDAKGKRIKPPPRPAPPPAPPAAPLLLPPETRAAAALAAVPPGYQPPAPPEPPPAGSGEGT